MRGLARRSSCHDDGEAEEESRKAPEAMPTQSAVKKSSRGDSPREKDEMCVQAVTLLIQLEQRGEEPPHLATWNSAIQKGLHRMCGGAQFLRIIRI